MSKKKIKPSTSKKESKRIVDEVLKEFNIIVRELVDKGICLEYSNFSIFENGKLTEITRNDRKNESNILYDSNKSVEEMLEVLLDKKEYNIMFFDRGIIQIELAIEDGTIVNERFIYINKQNGLFNKEQIEELKNEENNYEWYDEIIGIPVLLRMDYDVHCGVEIKHPTSHLTVSNCECCRIPMKGPMSVSMFIRFILNMFYDESVCDIITKYDKTITIKESEKKDLYLYWE